MSFQFQCPWCGCETSLRGATMESWRMKMPCDLCGREMQVHWDGQLAVGRVSTGEPMSRSEDVTVRIRKSALR